MKKNKEKVVYIDDGRTIADMSGVTGGFSHRSRPSWHPGPKFKEVWKTYWNAVRMMIKPTLVAAAAIGFLYALMYVLFSAM